MIGNVLLDYAIEYVADNHPEAEGNLKKDLAQAFIQGAITANNSLWNDVYDVPESFPILLLNEMTMETALIINESALHEKEQSDYTHWMPIEYPV